MVIFISCLVAVFCVAIVVLVFRIVMMQRELSSAADTHETERGKWRKYAEAVKAEMAHLAKYKNVADADAQAMKLRKEGQRILEQARAEAAEISRKALDDVEAIKGEVSGVLERAEADAKSITSEARQQANAIKEKARVTEASADEMINDAQRRAQEIAGDALDAKKNAGLYGQAAKAMKNIIEGYGNQYVIPERGLLDELADDVSYNEAGQRLKAAREHARTMVRKGVAGDCDEKDKDRRKRVLAFVVDSFNDKVELILSRTKRDNVGILGQEIRDAFSLVNFGGQMVGNARITDSYLDARLQELRWASIAQWLKDEDREEQRRIKEKIREEQKAAKEYAKAMRDAAKEEEMLKQMMEKTQEQVAKATAEQKAVFEYQLAELQQRLKEAEERNQMAISMARQTKKGNVYIISNVGSFGENVYKIGVTRRLEPLDRVRELGDSSVPFAFDVHALIMNDDAPALEYKLHQHFILGQVNKVNHRKEFFRTDLQHIREEIEKMGLKVSWTMKAAATEYWETQAIEKKIKDDPEAREAWIKRQLELEPVDESEAEVAAAEND